MPQERPTHAQIAAAIETASRAAAAASDARARYFRRHSPHRASALSAARDRCAEAAAPFRPWLGMVAWDGIALDDELAMKKIMEALRYERRQIDKMLI